MEKNTFRFTIDLPKDMHTSLKILCAEQSKTMKDVVINSLENKIEELKRILYEKKS